MMLLRQQAPDHYKNIGTLSLWDWWYNLLKKVIIYDLIMQKSDYLWFNYATPEGLNAAIL